MLAFPVLFCFLLVHIVLALTVEATKLGGELAMDTSFILFAKLLRFHILRCQEMGGGKGSGIPASEWRMQIQAAQGDAYSWHILTVLKGEEQEEEQIVKVKKKKRRRKRQMIVVAVKWCQSSGLGH